MRHAKTAEKLFDQMVDDASPELKKQLEMSFAIANKIDASLKSRGMNHKEFAHMIGHTEAEVSRWLSGTHNFTLSTLANISVTLGVDILSI